MPPLLRHIYEQLRDDGAYDTDWVDSLGWVLFVIFIILLILI